MCFASATPYLTLFPSWHNFLRMKTSSFHHLCQRSRVSRGCQQRRTRAWTLLQTSSGKKPEKGWWQQSVRHQYDRTPPQKVLTASKSTSPRPRPASESKPAPIKKLLTHFRHSLTQHKSETHTKYIYILDAQHRGQSLIAAQEICGDHK